MNNVLLFGSSGNIGSNLSLFLCKNKFNVFSVVKINSNLKKLKKLYKDANLFKHLKIIKSDISNIKKIDYIINEHSIDIIINCASYGVQKDQNNHKKAFNINSKYALDLLKVSKKNNIKHFIQLSTVMEYGFSKKIKKESSYLKGISMYGSSKAHGGKNCINFAKKHNLNYTYLRLSSIYGDPENLNNFIPLLLLSLKTQNDLKLTSGNQKRDYLHIDDLMSFFYKLLKNKSDKKVLVLNVASGKSYSLRSIGDMVSQKLKLKNNCLKWGKLKHTKDDNLDMKVSIDKAKLLLRWEPKLTLKKGIYKTFKKL